MTFPTNSLPPDRYLGPDPAQKALALRLLEGVAGLPYLCPHGHVDPRLFADESYSFGSPVDLLIIPDHYVFRMLYSQGIGLEQLGIPRRDESPVEQNHRHIWQIFAENIHLFRGTPSGIWLRESLATAFGITERLTPHNAQALYDRISEALATPDFRPRRLFERFNIEVLATTDAAHDSLSQHQAIRESVWGGRVIPTFRPDAALNLASPTWRADIEALSQVSGATIHDYPTFIQALEARRVFFKDMGARATDHAAQTAYTEPLSAAEAGRIFAEALRGQITADAARRFGGHMLIEMARMSREDGLVMQLHVGSYRDHNRFLWENFGRDKGGDIPVWMEFTESLRPLLNLYGNDPRLTLILFTLDESTYSRELAPLAGAYPALKLGPPWWFLDSLSGMQRYFETVMDTAGLYNTVGFNDDTRAFLSIPARHEVWRRASANWLAGLVLRHIVDEEEAADMLYALVYGLAKRAYGL